MIRPRRLWCVLAIVALSGSSCYSQWSPSLETAAELRIRERERRVRGGIDDDEIFHLTIRVDSQERDLSSAESWIKGAATAQRKGGQTGTVGHTWVEISDGEEVVCGGHSGECSNFPWAKFPETRVDGQYLTFSGGVQALSLLDPNAPSPYPALKNSLGKLAADPQNPVAWLFFIYKDGYWAKGSGKHSQVTHEATWIISENDYHAAIVCVRDLVVDEQAQLRDYGLTGMQCTSTVALIAKAAGVDLNPFIEMEIPPTVSIGGHVIRLREDTAGSPYGKIRFACPEAMARAISDSALNENRMWLSRSK
jgi:hypothetical protein